MKKTAIKPRKKSRVNKRFDLNNRKTRFLTIIGIIAILGGGFMLTRSFAATVFTWSGSGLVCSTNCTKANDASKNNASVVVLKPRATDSTAGGMMTISPHTFQLTSGRVYNICINAKGAGKLDIFLGTGLDKPRIGELSFFDASSYQNKCIPKYVTMATSMNDSNATCGSYIFNNSKFTGPYCTLNVRMMSTSGLVNVQQISITTPSAPSGK